MDVASLGAAADTADAALTILIDKLGLPDPDNPQPPGPWDPVIRGIDMAAVLGGGLPDPWRSVWAQGGGQPEPWLSLAAAAFGNGRPQPWLSLSTGPHPDPWLALDPYGSLASSWRSVVIEVIRRRHPQIEDAIGGWSGGWQRVALNPQPLPPRWAFALAAASQMVSRAEMIADMGRALGSGEAAGAWVVTLTDDICPTPRPWPWPWPWPRPNWMEDMIDAPDLTVVASVLSAASGRVADRDLAQALGDQAGRLAEESLSRLG